MVTAFQKAVPLRTKPQVSSVAKSKYATACASLSGSSRLSRILGGLTPPTVDKIKMAAPHNKAGVNFFKIKISNPKRLGI